MFIQLGQIYEATKVLCDHQSSMKIYRRLPDIRQQQQQGKRLILGFCLFFLPPLHNILPYQLIYMLYAFATLTQCCVLLNTVARRQQQ